MTICIDSLRACLEGSVPGSIATCDAEGLPNVTYVSQVHYVDREHVALSFQFFNKTRQNVLANPQVTVFLYDPRTCARYRLALLYRHTETEGPLFERMKAKLAGIASQTGMSGVFRLQGSDIYRILDIEHVAGPETSCPESTGSRLAALRQIVTAMSHCTDLGRLLDTTLASLESELLIQHAMVLFLDADGHKLYIVASRGYAQSGIGSEFPVGHGLIGMAAAQRTPIRIAHMAHEYNYSQAIREYSASAGMADLLETEIPFPGLTAPHSQLSVPIIANGRLLGVLHVESPDIQRFNYDDEDVLVNVASLLAATVLSLQQAAECAAEEPRAGAGRSPASGAPLLVRYYAANSSIFLDDDYLIKGLAGAIFWRLLQLNESTQRTEFSNRELRLDPTLRLPDFDDNLEARLILLQRRLAERNNSILIEKSGRGRFRLVLDRPLLRQEIRASR